MGLSSSPISCGSGLSCMIAALVEADNGVDIGDVVVVDTLYTMEPIVCCRHLLYSTIVPTAFHS